METKPLTIYTPTYNRASLLPRLYECLCAQTDARFVWLVVDDGSTDGTAALVAAWQAEGRLDIQYLSKENGGVHTARDLAYDTIGTELLCGVDSDDRVAPDFVGHLLSLWEAKGGPAYLGIIAPVMTDDGAPLGPPFPELPALSFQDLHFRYGCNGDQTIVVRPEVMRAIPHAPVTPGEKLVGEDYKWMQLPDAPFLLSRQADLYHSYLPDGYTQNARTLMLRNLHGAQAEAAVYIRHCRYFRPRIRAHIKYIICGLYLGEGGLVRRSPRPAATAALLPLGWLAYLIYRHKYGGRP